MSDENASQIDNLDELNDTDSTDSDSQDGVEGEDELSEFARKEISKKNSEAKNLRDRAKKAEAAQKELEQRLFAVENAGATAEDLLKNLQKENDTLKAQIAETSKAAMRADVARRFNIPDVLADRIQGDELDEMEEDAERLAQFGDKKVKRTENPALGKGGKTEKSNEDLFAEMLGV